MFENCINPGDTFFCATMRTGPIAMYGFDIAYIKLDDEILFQPGSDAGVELLTELDLKPTSAKSLDRLRETAARAMERRGSAFQSKIFQKYSRAI